MAQPTKRFRLRKLWIDRVDHVDAGANQEAHIVFAKRAKQDTPPPFAPPKRAGETRLGGVTGRGSGEGVPPSSPSGEPAPPAHRSGPPRANLSAKSGSGGKPQPAAPESKREPDAADDEAERKARKLLNAKGSAVPEQVAREVSKKYLAELDYKLDFVKEGVVTSLQEGGSQVTKHFGPGPHKGTGTEQTVHSGKQNIGERVVTPENAREVLTPKEYAAYQQALETKDRLTGNPRRPSPDVEEGAGEADQSPYHATEVAGYTYQADVYCPDCILYEMLGSKAKADALRKKEGSTEAALMALAERRGINLEDETTFDSDEFPKVILEIDADEPEICAGSHGAAGRLVPELAKPHSIEGEPVSFRPYSGTPRIGDIRRVDVLTLNEQVFTPEQYGPRVRAAAEEAAREVFGPDVQVEWDSWRDETELAHYEEDFGSRDGRSRIREGSEFGDAMQFDGSYPNDRDDEDRADYEEFQLALQARLGAQIEGQQGWKFQRAGTRRPVVWSSEMAGGRGERPNGPFGYTRGPDGQEYDWELRDDGTLYARRVGTQRWKRAAVNVKDADAARDVIFGLNQHKPATIMDYETPASEMDQAPGKHPIEDAIRERDRARAAYWRIRTKWENAGSPEEGRAKVTAAQQRWAAALDALEGDFEVDQAPGKKGGRRGEVDQAPPVDREDEFNPLNKDRDGHPLLEGDEVMVGPARRVGTIASFTYPGGEAFIAMEGGKMIRYPLADVESAYPRPIPKAGGRADSYATGDPKFDTWMKKVDEAVQRRTGLSVYDLEDMPFRDMYDDGDSPSHAAARAIRNSKGGGWEYQQAAEVDQTPAGRWAPEWTGEGPKPTRYGQVTRASRDLAAKLQGDESSRYGPYVPLGELKARIAALGLRVDSESANGRWYRIKVSDPANGGTAEGQAMLKPGESPDERDPIYMMAAEDISGYIKPKAEPKQRVASSPEVTTPHPEGPRRAGRDFSTPEVGDVLVASWGYDQTNIDAYEVVGVTGSGKSVRVVRIQTGLVPERSGRGYDYVVPVPGSRYRQDWLEEDEKKPRLYRVGSVYDGKYSINLGVRGSASPWDGRREFYETAIGFGH